MERLLELLKELEKSDIKPRDFVTSEHHKNVAEIEELLESMCIDKTGGIHMGNVSRIKNSGYYVFPVERDSFGWLLGGVETTKGTITFG
jgi:hypothetical protein